jgi:hypothetical protein
MSSASVLTFLPGGDYLTIQFIVKVKIKVTLRLAAYRQSVRLVKPLKTHDQRFFSTETLQ